MSNKAIEILLLSDSRLLIDGLRKILESEVCIRVLADLSDMKEVLAFMDENEPDYILLDQRVKSAEMNKYLRSREFSSKKTELILLSDEEESEDSTGKFLKIGHNTSARELMDLMTDSVKYREKIKHTKKLAEEKSRYVTSTESRIISLVTSGHTNKEIAEKLKVSEKTIKAHITSIFTKLSIQNRYQLMVYGRRNKVRM